MSKIDLKNLKTKTTFFGSKYLFLNDKTRIRYGYCFKHFGKAYTKEIKKGFFWKEIAWTYAETHINSTLEDVIMYLDWYERYTKPKKSSPLF